MRAARAGERAGPGRLKTPVLVVPRAPAYGAFACLRAVPAPEIAGPVATSTSTAREGRPVAKAEKVTAVAELTERFQSSSGAVLTEYRGLTVAQLGELRKSLDGH